jgi:predicted phage terminase large subunit-like protein
VKFTARQLEAQKLLAGAATHILLYGGSRSGKTFLIVRAIIMRALKAAGSRHAILRFRFNHVRQTIGEDTFPKVMKICFPEIKVDLDTRDWFYRFPNGSEIWLGGVDDKERTEKILGAEYASVFLNEVSQIPLTSRNIALTRLAQAVEQRMEGRINLPPLKPRMYYDCNPPNKGHWCYRLFGAKEDPETGRPLPFPEDYDWMRINPVDNAENLAPDYVSKTLAGMPARMRKRFLEGEFGEANPNALWSEDILERWRVMNANLPDLQRVIVGVDPSGSGDEDNADNDEIGIVVVALGTDGVGYVLEDCSLKAGPATWGATSVSAFNRHAGDAIVGEVNYGGAMVEHVIRTATARGDRRPPFKAVTASRGKVVRAEPISALFEQGKVRLVGEFHALEQELLAFSTTGYTGEGSPNRADAMIWACYELFPGIIRMQQRMAGREAYANM